MKRPTHSHVLADDAGSTSVTEAHGTARHGTARHGTARRTWLNQSPCDRLPAIRSLLYWSHTGSAVSNCCSAILIRQYSRMRDYCYISGLLGAVGAWRHDTRPRRSVFRRDQSSADAQMKEFFQENMSRNKPSEKFSEIFVCATPRLWIMLGDIR